MPRPEGHRLPESLVVEAQSITLQLEVHTPGKDAPDTLEADADFYHDQDERSRVVLITGDCPLDHRELRQLTHLHESDDAEVDDIFGTPNADENLR